MRERGVRAGHDRRRGHAAGRLRAARPHRAADPGQPAVVALPVPEPYGARYVRAARDRAVAARRGRARSSTGCSTRAAGRSPSAAASRPVERVRQARLPAVPPLRQLANDVTRPYVDALEARGVPHVLVGGKAFHEREEVEAIRAALAADRVAGRRAVGVRDAARAAVRDRRRGLLEWTHRFGSACTPVPALPASVRGHAAFDERRHRRGELAHLQPIVEALRAAAAAASRAATTRPVAETHRTSCSTQPARTSASCCGPAGEQALANVLHVAELARQYEAGGGISFRGFVDELRLAADDAQAAEAPILEEGSDGVRMMTVHKAKGLEFPDRRARGPDVQARARGRRPLDRSRQRPVRAEAWRLGADRSAAARRRERRATAPKASGWPTSRRRGPATCSWFRPSATRSTKAAGSTR